MSNFSGETFQENIGSEPCREAMSDESEQPDPAAVFGCALSLWHECKKAVAKEGLNLSECYNGGDEFMLACPRLLIHSL